VKANQVKPTPETNPNWMTKASQCHYCQQPIKATYGVAVGGNTYCNYVCLSDQQQERRNANKKN